MAIVKSEVRNIIMIRGWASLEESFSGLIKTCPDGKKIEIIASESLLKDFNIENAAERVIRILDKKRIKKAVIAGHSLGGAVALMLAFRYPEYVDKLILLNSEGIKADKIGFDAFKKLVLENVRKPGITLYRKLKEGAMVLKNPGFEFKLGFFAHNLDLEKEARGISVPTLLLWGDKDQLIPFSKGERMHSLIKNSKLIRLTGMDHDWIMHSPRLFWKNINPVVN